MINRLKSIMDPDEKRVRQEDCNEDTMGVGILTLTNKRAAFDKKHCQSHGFFRLNRGYDIRCATGKYYKSLEGRFADEKSVFYCKNK